MSLSPTQLTLRDLRESYRLVQVVEHWNTFARKRFDLFGFIDIVAVERGERTLGVQCTSYSNMSARKKKIEEEHRETKEILLTAGWDLEIWGWRKVKGKWVVKIERLK